MNPSTDATETDLLAYMKQRDDERRVLLRRVGFIAGLAALVIGLAACVGYTAKGFAESSAPVSVAAF